VAWPRQSKEKDYDAEEVRRACGWGFERFSLSASLSHGLHENSHLTEFPTLWISKKEEKMIRFQGVELGSHHLRAELKRCPTNGCTETPERAAGG